MIYRLHSLYTTKPGRQESIDGDKSEKYEITLSYSPGNGREKETQEYADHARNSILEGGYCLQSSQGLPLPFALIYSPSPASLKLFPILYNLKS